MFNSNIKLFFEIAIRYILNANEELNKKEKTHRWTVEMYKKFTKFIFYIKSNKKSKLYLLT